MDANLVGLAGRLVTLATIWSGERTAAGVVVLGGAVAAFVLGGRGGVEDCLASWALDAFLSFDEELSVRNKQ